MGKKKGKDKRKGSRGKGDEEDFSDDASEYSVDTRKEEKDEAAAMESSLLVEERLQIALDSLDEKRGTSRVAGLKSLEELMTNHFCNEFVADRCRDIVSTLLRCGRTDSDSESVAAAKCLAVLSVTMGENMKGCLPQLYQALSPNIKFEGCDPSVRCAELSALATACFFGDEDDDWTPRTMELITDLLREDDEAVLTEALEDWALLATSYSPHGILLNLQRQYLPLIVQALECTSVNARVAAAYAIALFAEASHIVMQGEEEDEEEEENAGPSWKHNMQHAEAARQYREEEDSDNEGDQSDDDEDLEDFVGVTEDEDLLAQLRAMYKDCDKHKSKRDRQVQRAAMRQVLATLEDGEMPTDSFKLRHAQVDVCGWIQRLQCSALRKVLGGGIQTHLQENAAVQSLLDFHAEDCVKTPEKMSSIEKRLFMSPSSEVSKQRDLDRKKGRAGSHKASKF